MKKAAALIAGLAIVLAVTGCSEKLPSAGEDTQTTVSTVAAASGSTATSAAPAVASGGDETVGQGGTTSYSDALTLAYDENDLDAAWDSSKSSLITLAGDGVRFDGRGATVAGSTVTIDQAGTYVVTGTADDAQIVVDCDETGLVRLVLNGADLSCATSAPVYVKSAEKVVLTLADGTRNTLTDGETYTLDADSNEPNAALFSDTDLTINGGGALTVIARYNDGITSTDDLKIVSGSLTIDAANDAVKGKDALGIKDAALTINAKGDGLQSTNDGSPDKGFICIAGGTFDVSAGSDGLQAASTLLVTGGEFSIVTGGGSENAAPHQSEFGGGFPGGGRDQTTTTEAAAAESEDESSSSKGLKAGGGVFVEAGTFALDCADDAIHSNGAIDVKGGTFTMASGDDAVHADVSVTFAAGDLTISTCYEGIESNVITFDDARVIVTSSDDAINGVNLGTPTAVTPSAGGSSTTTTVRMGGGFGGAFPGESGNARLIIAGGYLALDAGGDGIDINGSVEMSGGTVIVNGPTNDGNGALDWATGFTVTGGLLVAAGSAGMAQAPDESSTQYSIIINFEQAQTAGTIVRIVDEGGKPVLTMAPSKQFRSLVLCSPELKQGGTYKVYLGGTMAGTATDTVYSDGTYSGGTEYASLTLESVVTLSGAAGMMGGGFGGGMGGGTLPGGGTGGGRPDGGHRDGTWGGGTGDTPPGGGTAPNGGAAPDGSAMPGGAPSAESST